MATDVTDASFDADVIERSHEVPVLVDFWAPWCGPCRMLGPVLDEVAAEAEGRFELVKVNTDESPQVSSRYGIRSIPAVKLFSGGTVVGEFVGAQPGGTIRKFLDQHLPSEADDACAAGQQALATHDDAAAKAAFERALQIDPRHAEAHLALARLALAAGDADAVAEHAEALDPGTPEHEQADFLRRALVFRERCEAIGGQAEAEARLAADEGDLDARHALGCCHALAQRYEPALEAFLEVVMHNRKHDGGAAHQAMLTIFGILGRGDALRDTYQRKLQIYT